MPDAHIESLNQAEVQWIGDHITVLTEAGVDIRDAGALSGHYDTLLSDWLSLPEEQRPDPNPMINLIGLGLGEHLAHRTGLSWVVASDEQTPRSPSTVRLATSSSTPRTRSPSGG
jgi:hypothetical protein